MKKVRVKKKGKKTKKKKWKVVGTPFPGLKYAKWIWMDRKSWDAQPAANRGYMPVNPNHYYVLPNLEITKDLTTVYFNTHSDTSYEVYVDGKRIISYVGQEIFNSFKITSVVLNKTTEANPNTISIFVGDEIVYKTTKTTKKIKKKNGKIKKKTVTKTINTDRDHNEAFIMTIQQQVPKNAAKAGKVIFRTDTSNLRAYHGSTPPRWSRGLIFMTLLEEASDRGNESAEAILAGTNSSLKFYPTSKLTSGAKTLYTDHNGRVSPTGVYSTSAQSVEIGITALDVQAKFSEQGDFDVVIDPDTLGLKIYNSPGVTSGSLGRNLASHIALMPGTNLLSYSVNEIDAVINVIYAKYGDSNYIESNLGTNYDTALGDGSTAFLGEREGFIELGSQSDAISALTMANSILASTVDTSKFAGANDIVSHLNKEYTGSLLPIHGSVPFLDFGVGDTVSAPRITGLYRAHRVLSLSCTEDENGNLIFEPELEVQ